MATDAIGIDMRAVEGEVGVDVVVEGRGLPGDFRVAFQAIAGEAGFDVDRIVGIGEVVLVAVDTIGRRALVDVIDMAFGAGDGRMCAVEGEVGAGVVIEVDGCPGRFTVALQAIGRKAQDDVIGVLYVIVVCLVAVGAIIAQAGEFRGDLAAFDSVTVGAIGGSMRPRQSKTDAAVVEGRIGPSGDLMAEHAIKIWRSLRVQEALAGAKIVEVARCARTVPIDELAIDMA